MNQVQSTKQQVKGLGSLFLLGLGYCPKKNPHNENDEEMTIQGKLRLAPSESNHGWRAYKMRGVRCACSNKENDLVD